MTTPDTPSSAPSSPDDELLALAASLFDAARGGDGETLLAYLEAGAPATMRDAAGNSLLMLAAYHGHAELTDALAARGADVDQVNDRGQSPLAGAAFKGFVEVAGVLLRHGADPDAGTPSARETAAYFGNAEIGALIEEHAPRS